MMWSSRTNPRRAEIRKNRPDYSASWWQDRRADGSLASVGIALVFCIIAIGIMWLREDIVPYRPGQYVAEDIHSRVAFNFQDKTKLQDLQHQARERTARVYKVNDKVWDVLEDKLLELPEVFAGKSMEQLSPTMVRSFELDAGGVQTQLDGAAVTAFDQSRSGTRREGYEKSVHEYIKSLRELIILPEAERAEEVTRHDRLGIAIPRIAIAGNGEVRLSDTHSTAVNQDLITRLTNTATTNFQEQLRLRIVAFTVNNLQPTHLYDEDATAARQNEAERSVPPQAAYETYQANRVIVREGYLSERGYQLLREEHEAFLDQKLSRGTWAKAKLGAAGIVVVLTIALAGYIAKYQPRVVRNHARAIAIGVLLLSMLLLAQLAAIGTGPLYIFGVGPTVLAAMILAIAYDRRFAFGIATVHGILVTAALDQGIGFFIILFAGTATCCFLLDDIRSRSKLIEVGGATALAMMFATLATGSTQLDPIEPLSFIARNCLHAGAAGLACGFVVLGILPFIEKAFRITTSMTLLELADASQPLMRRLALEAPGTYNHSLQVATLAEEAAEAIGANSLLCRVGAYYHDVGKINKADYFVENQVDGVNRHINLSPSVSLLIIIGHVKDGIELAREYNLPTSLFPFIQQHHGTTLVEYFYNQARQKGTDQPSISEAQYRYPGPKPRSREIAIVMLADACESATRCLSEHNPARIEALVHDLALKRLLDGQFDECDLTMRELELVERSLTKTLLGIYHGRISYPAKEAQPAATTNPAPAARTA